MRSVIKWTWIFLAVFTVSAISLPAIDVSVPLWQAQAVAGIELAQEGGLEDFYQTLPLIWAENESVRRFFAPKLDKNLLRKSLQKLEELPSEGRRDSMVLRTLALLRAALDVQENPSDKVIWELVQAPIDLRQEAVDIALYHGDLQQAEAILTELEGQEVRAEWTYRRAVIAGRRGQNMLASSLWHEAIGQGLPLTAAVKKELGKAGLRELAGARRYPRNVEELLSTMIYLTRREGNPNAFFYPSALRSGNEAFENQQYEEAIIQWTEILGDRTYEAKVSYMLGQALARLGRTREARDAFNGSLRMQPSFFLPYLGMARLSQMELNGQSAADWLEQGYYRTGSGYLFKTAGNIKKVSHSIRKTQSGNVLINLDNVITRDSDGVWISWNRGRDWLWYPWLQAELYVPEANEYWVAGTRGSEITGEAILTPIEAEIPKSSHPLRIQMGQTGTMELVWNWEKPVSVQVEYWTVKGPRRRVPLTAPARTHQLLLDVENGLTYFFRATAYNGKREIVLKEGNFTTPVRQGGIALSLEGGMYPRLYPKVETITGQSFSSGPLQLRMAEEGKAWSDWRLVFPEMAWDLPSGDGIRKLNFQYKDARGVLSPVLTETVLVDSMPPAFLGQNPKKSDVGRVISFRTDEPAVVSLWVKIENRWRLERKTRQYSKAHSVRIPLKSVAYQLWLEDKTGNVIAVSGEQPDEQGPVPLTLRINNGVETVRNTRVRLQTLLPELKGDFSGRIRFSNDGRIWSPWETLKDEYQWRLSPGQGPKQVLAQVQVGLLVYPLRAEVFLDRTPPSPKNVSFTRVAGKVIAVWETTEPAKSRFYLSSGGVFRMTESGELKKKHRVDLGILDPLRYSWRLESYDSAGNQAVLDGGAFQGNATVLNPPAMEWDYQLGSLSNGPIHLTFRPGVVGPKAIRMRLPGRPWSDWTAFESGLPRYFQTKTQKQSIEIQFRGEEGNLSPAYRVGQHGDERPPRFYNVRFQQLQGGVRLTWSSDKPATCWVFGAVTTEEGEVVRVQQVYQGFGMNGSMELGRLAPGTYRFRVFPRDERGNWTWTSWFFVEVLPDATDVSQK